MNSLTGNLVGSINITVFETDNNKQFFYLEAENKNLIPVLDFLDNSLTDFKSNNS